MGHDLRCLLAAGRGRFVVTSASFRTLLLLGRSVPWRDRAGSLHCSSCSSRCKPGKRAMAWLERWGEGLCGAAGGHAACSLHSAQPVLVPRGLESTATIDSEGGVMEKHPRAPVLSHTSARAPLPTCERQLHCPKVHERDEIVAHGYVLRELASLKKSGV